MKENLSLFLQLAEQDQEEAKRIFFGKKFKEYYLQNEKKLQIQYDLLLEGQDQNQILEEFLVCAGAKEPVKFKIPENKQAIWEKNVVKPLQKQTIKGVSEQVQEYYLFFRCGKMTLSEFCEKSYEQVLKEECMEADLFRFQLAILNGQEEEAENRRDQLLEERPWEEGGFIESYYYYLEALYEKQAPVQKKILDIIRKNAEQDLQHQQYYAWFLLYLDEEIVYSSKRQIELIKDIAKKEKLLPFLKYEIVSTWNRNPFVMKEADSFTVDAMKFGWEYQIVSKDVCSQYARIVRRTSDFQKEAFYLLEKIYQKYQEEDFLFSICNLLLQTGKSDQKYHKYIKEAVRKSLKMKGLFEAYIRTMDQTRYEMIDMPVIHYFSYSSSLSEDENAYLYVNLCMNETAYGDIVRSYQTKILLFVRNSIKRGLISDRYVYLYRKYLPQLSKEEEFLTQLPNIIFKKKISFDHPHIKKIVVKHLEKEHVEIYEAEGQSVYCDIYSDRFMFVFYDQEGNPYISSVHFKIKDIFDTEKYENMCKYHSVVHEKLLIREAWDFRKKSSFQKEDIKIALRMQNSLIISSELKELILEMLLDYYYINKEYENLETFLKQVQWEKIREKSRVSIIEYFISREFYEEAIKGMERYGFEKVNPDLLTKAAFYLIDQLNGMKSAFTAHMCETLFSHQIYEPKILLYLQQHIPLEAEYQMDLWRKGMEHGVYDADYTEYILVKAAENGNLDADTELIFLTYVRHSEENEKLSHFILEEFGKRYFSNGRTYTKEFSAYLMRFLQKYGWKEIHYPLSWLHNISKREKLTMQEKELAADILEAFAEQDIYMKFFLKFDGKIHLPQRLYCISFVTYHGKPSSHVLMHYRTGKDGIIKEMPMKEILNGTYIAYFQPFVGEESDVYVTINGDEKEYRECVSVEKGPTKGKGLKYHKINEMLSMVHSEKVYDLMEQFDETEYLIEKALEPWA